MTNIGEIFTAIDGLEKLPLGSIIAWNEIDVAGHPLNWVECDGRVIQGMTLHRLAIIYKIVLCGEVKLRLKI